MAAPTGSNMGPRSQHKKPREAVGSSERGDLLVGAHMSIAGGVHRAIARGEAVGCTAIQIFTKNASQWKAPRLTEEAITAFKNERSRTGILVVSHDAYLINLASPDADLRAKSQAAFLDEMERAEALEIPHLVIHPGAHTGAGEDEGLRHIVTSFNAVLKSTRGFRVKIALENTAGQGTALGYSLAHLERIITESTDPERFSVCIDTCHAFAAGYDLRDRASYDSFMEQFDTTIGLKKLGVMHINDCKRGLGSRVDRHEHIGRGMLGIDCFRLIMNDPRLVAVPKLMETPKELEGRDMDVENLGILRGLVAATGKRSERRQGRHRVSAARRRQAVP